jgi:hypothetical protein
LPSYVLPDAQSPVERAKDEGGSRESQSCESPLESMCSEELLRNVEEYPRRVVIRNSASCICGMSSHGDLQQIGSMGGLGMGDMTWEKEVLESLHTKIDDAVYQMVRAATSRSAQR